MHCYHEVALEHTLSLVELHTNTFTTVDMLVFNGYQMGYMWGNGQHVCFLSECLPPTLEDEFEPYLGFEFLAFSEAQHLRFSPGTPVSSPRLFTGFSQ